MRLLLGTVTQLYCILHGNKLSGLQVAFPFFFCEVVSKLARGPLASDLPAKN